MSVYKDNTNAINLYENDIILIKQAWEKHYSKGNLCFMKIIECEEKYLEDVRDLLVELEEYIISIDKDNQDQIYEDYWELKALRDLKEVKKMESVF